MSYDLYLFRPEPGEDPMDTLERLEEQEQQASPDPALTDRNRRIADALMRINSKYTESQIKHDVIAEQMGVTVEDARARHRYIELFDEDGLQITLSDEQASINFPYWESLDPKLIAEEIAKASKVIREETGWELYDPQLERFIDPVADAHEFARAFGVGVSHVQHIASEQEGEGQREHRGWRRLFRRR